MTTGVRALKKADWQTAACLAGAGAFGGLLSWLFAMLQNPPSLQPPLAYLPGYILLGSGAACVGVYLIANSDTSAVLRAMAFALVCGFSWKMVFDAGSLLVKQTIDQHSFVQGDETAKKLTQALKEAPADAKADKVKSLADTTVKILDTAPSIADPALKDIARDRAVQSVESISNSDTTAFDAAVSALGAIGKAGARSGMPTVKEKALESLREFQVKASGEQKKLVDVQLQSLGAS